MKGGKRRNKINYRKVKFIMNIRLYKVFYFKEYIDFNFFKNMKYTFSMVLKNFTIVQLLNFLQSPTKFHSCEIHREAKKKLPKSTIYVLYNF